ncbi:hypothetical protein F441_21564 [Phytophthora nicotianae CJ01A1]|uniref:Uncharacterized protein n=6 Tax=Phytophthora nicotianae TaxID=4792 RepID=W2QUN7_PHYN3|nr:hypothetical protein PPTG_21887 [Phytophthora nicotianae INRA-310]ETI31337.1 hypothetical protein F443_21674 [Phytophthora nicotianae P1569]ETK71722.1 hypothetical protein L915_21078 [Phytophthora nicotianae]ETO60037.1 hypothetical protein F444_21713 [Phytophthora nicotianae P1976]ETP01141.1 hypothetical protein F441_21564 [Phytophthora nicotianae CJ01A1]ETP29294.1 hypothetical protein F442_21532 [Phytophthora nicotianae P10297]
MAQPLDTAFRCAMLRLGQRRIMHQSHSHIPPWR